MIFYFSATGNTRWVARKVAQITGEKLYSIPDVVKSQYAYTLERDERIGFMFPIHGWRPPTIAMHYALQAMISDRLWTILTKILQQSDYIRMPLSH